MAAAVAIPEHKLFESPNSRTIEVGDWKITTTTNPISNATECDNLQASLAGMPLPEMTFGNNSLELRHKPSGWRYAFNTERALKCVKNGELVAGDGGVKVGYADAWLQSRCVPFPYVYMNPGRIVVAQAPLPNPRCRGPYPPNHTTGHTPQCTQGMRLGPLRRAVGDLLMKLMSLMQYPLPSSVARIPYYSTRRSHCLRMNCTTMVHRTFLSA